MRKRIRVLGWLLIALTPPMFLAGIEGCVRLFDVSPAFERDAAVPPWLDRNVLVKDARWMELLSSSPRDLRNYYSTYAWDRYLFYRLRPNLAIPLTDVLAPEGLRERTRWTLRTNARGYPGREAGYGAHPGTFRILCMGDSSTFGWGVEAEAAYPALLEAVMRRRHPERKVQVVNLGVCGYSSLQGKILFEREGVRYQPDLVTLSYGSNDWSRVPEPFDVALRRNLGWTGAVREVLHLSRAYQIYTAFLTRALRRDDGSAGAGTAPAAAGMPYDVGPEASRSNIAEMIESARRAGADSVLVSNCVPGEMADPIRLASRDRNAPLVDTEALLRSAIPGLAAGRDFASERAQVVSLYGEAMLREYPDLEVYLADRCHPNVVGQAILARAIADVVEASPAYRGGPRE